MVPLARWAPLDIEITWDANEATIVLTTNVPCHLFMHWTIKQPWVHPTTRTVRGLSVPWSAYWCFVVWHENEQEEAGDTYIHTFIKPDWIYCVTRWFYFHGTIEGETSPSESPIFSHHYTGDWYKVFIELWSWHGEAEPEWDLLFTEEWTWLGEGPPSWALLFMEEWS